MVCEVDTTPFTTTTSAPTTSTTTLPAGPTVNGCDATHATDLRGETDVTVQFGVGFDIFDYAPESIIVTPGTRVMFSGSFQTHPLVGGQIVGDAAEPDPTSPFGRTDSGSMRTFELDAPGTYGYYCDAHGVALHTWGAVIVAP
jgi:plastocyanin